MSRQEIITHLIRIRRQDHGYYKWAAPRYEALDMPGLVEEVESAWSAMTDDERQPPWLRDGAQTQAGKP